MINAEIHEDILYRPRQKDTRQAYNQILNIVQKHIGDVPLDTLKAATDEVLAILKTDNLRDTERKKEIEGIIDQLDDLNFNQLTILASKITDYDPEDQTNAVNREEIIEVDVDLNKEDESSDSSDDVYVKDREEEKKQGLVPNKAMDRSDDEQMSDEEAKVVKVGKNNAFWVQSLLQSFIKNQSRAKEFYNILNVDKPEECEIKILHLVKYYDSL